MESNLHKKYMGPRYKKRYKGDVLNLFNHMEYITEWKFGHDLSWTRQLYRNCITKFPMQETFSYRKIEEEFLFDFIVFSYLDDGTDIDHFHGFSVDLYDEVLNDWIDDIKNLTSKYNENLAKEIEPMLNPHCFVFIIDGSDRKHTK
jgi:hypothetical protein